jgi:hypothetical protein
MTFTSTSYLSGIYIKNAVNWRLDHCVFDWRPYWDAHAGNGVFLTAYGGTHISFPYGLIDNNEIYDTKVVHTGTGGSAPYLPAQSKIFAETFALGDAADGKLTTYMEDNYIVKRSGNHTDANYGGAYTLRYNYIDDRNWGLVHAVQEGNRAGRIWEVYGNDYNRTYLGGDWRDGKVNLWPRAGTGVVLFNRARGLQPTTGSTYFVFDLERVGRNTDYTGLCNGEKPWDGAGAVNAPGYPCRDQIGRASDTGLWYGYNVKSCTDNGAGKVRVTTSTNHNLTEADTYVMIVPQEWGSVSGCTGLVSTTPHPVLAVGADTVDIDLAYTSDIVAASKPKLMGRPPVQPLTPAYSIGNRDTERSAVVGFGIHISAHAGTEYYIVEDRDYYNEDTAHCPANAEGTCSAGVGFGTLANRPANCTAGTGYWATAQTYNADLSGTVGIAPANPLSGTLYVCSTGGDAWEEYFTPYDYPHPLRDGDGGETYYVLSVAKAGDGNGTVTSDLGGISCGTTCSASLVEDTTVTLTATPSSGGSFTGWSGEGCSGTGTCVVTMSAARSVTATFNPPLKYNVIISYTGTGSGTTDPAAGYVEHNAEDSVSISATPSDTSTFTGWSGTCGCSGTSDCEFEMPANDCTAIATFTDNSRYSITVIYPEHGETVHSSAYGINCGNDHDDCYKTYYSGETITLTPTCADYWYDPQYSGDCTGSTCELTLTENKAVGLSCTHRHNVRGGSVAGGVMK